MAMCGFTRCGVPEGLATVERFMRAFEVGDLTDGQCQGRDDRDVQTRGQVAAHRMHAQADLRRLLRRAGEGDGQG